MKSTVNVPLILLVAYSSYFIYLIHFGIAITLPISLVFIFLVLLYGLTQILIHFKKPDHNIILQKQIDDLNATFTLKAEKLDSRISSLDIGNNMKAMANIKGPRHG